MGRTSTRLPPGQDLAIARASSRSLTSTMAKPPSTSFDSMKGPSVTVTLPFLRRTVVAVCGPCSSSPPTILPDLLCSSNHCPTRAYAASASALGIFSHCSCSSADPANMMMYFIPASIFGGLSSPLHPYDEQKTRKSTRSSGAREFRLLFAEEAHDADRCVGAEGGAREVVRLDLERLIQWKIVSAPDRILDHRDREGGCSRQLPGQLVDSA